MSQSHMLRKHHRSIIAMAGELQAALAEPKPAVRMQKAVHSLSRLAGLLALHLSLEDKVMYPRLQAQRDYSIVETSRLHFAAVGGFKESFEAYRRKWMKPGALDAAWPQFESESSSMLAALRERIAREEKDIYHLLDELGI